MDFENDIKTTWEFRNGDLVLVGDENNIIQSIANRLSCYKPNLNSYYDNYGGFLSNYFGRRRTQQTLDFMKIEIDTILDQDPRITEFETNLQYNEKGAVELNLIITDLNNDEDVELNMVLDGEDIEVITDAD